jgi:hypothetical protein
MAVSSLTRMTVPLASDQSNPNQGLLMPKLKYRFRVIFENFGVSTPRTELTKQVMDFTRPTVSFEPIDIPIYNSTIKLAGKYSWGDLTCNLRDDAGGNVSKLVGEQLQKQLDFHGTKQLQHLVLTTSSLHDLKCWTAGNGANEPIALETWEIYGCYLSEVNYNNMDYSESAPVTVSMTIRFDNAVQTPAGSGVGAVIGRTVGDVATGAGGAA